MKDRVKCRVVPKRTNTKKGAISRRYTTSANVYTIPPRAAAHHVAVSISSRPHIANHLPF